MTAAARSRRYLDCAKTRPMTMLTCVRRFASPCAGRKSILCSPPRRSAPGSGKPRPRAPLSPPSGAQKTAATALCMHDKRGQVVQEAHISGNGIGGIIAVRVMVGGRPGERATSCNTTRCCILLPRQTTYAYDGPSHVKYRKILTNFNCKSMSGTEYIRRCYPECPICQRLLRYVLQHHGNSSIHPF